MRPFRLSIFVLILLLWVFTLRVAADVIDTGITDDEEEQSDTPHWNVSTPLNLQQEERLLLRYRDPFSHTDPSDINLMLDEPVREESILERNPFDGEPVPDNLLIKPLISDEAEEVTPSANYFNEGRLSIDAFGY